MILFAFKDYQNLADQLWEAEGITRGDFDLERFGDGEMYVMVNSSVKDQECVVLASISPPDENIFALLTLAHTLKKEGAKKVTALVPYMAYSRQDRDKPGESMITDLLGPLFKSSGIDHVMTVTMHSETGIKMMDMPFENLDATQFVSQTLKEIVTDKTTIVAPDEGARAQCQKYAQALGKTEEVTYCKKTRTHDGIMQTDPIGPLSDHVIIIDDMLATGGTLVSTCKHLQKAGVENIDVYVTHGIFAGDKWKGLFEAGVQTIWCTDSIPQNHRPKHDKIKEITLAPLLTEAIT